ncbi:5-formyltetrahydrofolate cyclo-ligase [Xanthomarina sp. F2636L]|uniref:5-formyltetrahydrofolate cyclo-ligase n=1 Tax=Xanthomarina sp. F2636L TaxID=2996018 RepID=UPI00225E6F66|nr:5-formyltetrahydrofolate cyclo-ligase [Xanthomarina sp. F2636L]MCX7551116.1 5-formyltetrahydrofolate cyclo-ligase [Xanthomarina sp. F2636L]
MTKAELRKTYKLKRQELSSEVIEDLSLQIANRLLSLPIWEFSFYHLFLSIEEHKEINTDYILNILSGKDKNIVISKSDFTTGNLTHFLLTDGTVIKKNAYNIPEPIDGIEVSNQKLEVVFVPLLAFDKQGHRVGYGKGFYDRFLAECKPETIKIGFSFFEAETIIEDVFEGDMALDYCVTPTQVYHFN